MKAITNKTIIIQGKETTYAKLISEHIQVAPQGGLTYDLMCKISRVLPTLEKGGEAIELEDADFEFVKEKITNAVWGFYSEEFKNLVDYIKSL